MLIVAAIAIFAVAQDNAPKMKADEGMAPKMMIKCEKMMAGPGMGMGMMGGKMSCGMGGCGNLAGMKEELGLSDDQVNKLKAMKLAQEKQAIKDRAEVQLMGIDLRELLCADNVDVKAVDAQLDKMGAMKVKMQKAKIHGMIDAKNVLTPEQKEKLKGCGMGSCMMGGPKEIGEDDED